MRLSEEIDLVKEIIKEKKCMFVEYDAPSGYLITAKRKGSNQAQDLAETIEERLKDKGIECVKFTTKRRGYINIISGSLTVVINPCIDETD